MRKETKEVALLKPADLGRLLLVDLELPHPLPVRLEPPHRLLEVYSVLPPHLQLPLVDLAHLHQQPGHLGLRQLRLLVPLLHLQQVYSAHRRQLLVLLLHLLEVYSGHRLRLQLQEVCLGHQRLFREEAYSDRPLLPHLLLALADLELPHPPLPQLLVLLLHRREVYLGHPHQLQEVYLVHRHLYRLLVLLLRLLLAHQRAHLEHLRHQLVCLAQHLRLLQLEVFFLGQPRRHHLYLVHLLRQQDLCLERQLQHRLRLLQWLPHMLPLHLVQ